MTGVNIYTIGIGFIHCCVPEDVPRSDVEAEVNRQNPTGIKDPWRISNHKTFVGGAPNPHRCDCKILKDVAVRLHYAMDCRDREIENRFGTPIAKARGKST